MSASQKRLALTAAIMGSFVAGLDATVVNVALPAIGRNLGGGLAGQQWVANAYLLSLGSLILLGGSVGDVWGERRAPAASSSVHLRLRYRSRRDREHGACHDCA